MYFKLCDWYRTNLDKPVFVFYGWNNELNPCSKYRGGMEGEETASVCHPFSCSFSPDVFAAADCGEPRCVGLENVHCAHRLIQHSKVGGARLLEGAVFHPSTHFFPARFMCLCGSGVGGSSALCCEPVPPPHVAAVRLSESRLAPIRSITIIRIATGINTAYYCHADRKLKLRTHSAPSTHSHTHTHEGKHEPSGESLWRAYCKYFTFAALNNPTFCFKPFCRNY